MQDGTVKSGIDWGQISGKGIDWNNVKSGIDWGSVKDPNVLDQTQSFRGQEPQSNIPTVLNPLDFRQRSDQGISDIAQASKEKKFTSPQIQADEYGIVKSREADAITKKVVQTLSEPVNRIYEAGVELSKGELGQSAIDAVAGVVHGIMLPFTAPISAVSEGLKQTGYVGREIASGLERTMNLPFDALRGLSGLIDTGLNELGVDTKKIEKTLGVSPELSKKANDLMIELGGLVLMAKSHSAIKDSNAKEVPIPKVETANVAPRLDNTTLEQGLTETPGVEKPINISQLPKNEVTKPILDIQNPEVLIDTQLAQDNIKPIETAKPQEPKPVEKPTELITERTAEDYELKPDKMKDLPYIALKVGDKIYKAKFGEKANTPNGAIYNHLDLAEKYNLLDEKNIESGFVNKGGKFVTQGEISKPVPEVKAVESQTKTADTQVTDVPLKTEQKPSEIQQTEIPTAIPNSGETKVRGLAQSTEAKAIVSDITKSIEGLPEYEVLKNEPQIKVAADLIANDLPRAKRIAMGEEKAPDTMLPGFVYKGLEDYAIKNNDLQLIKDLGTSSYLAEQGTIAGQFIQSLRNQDPLSPVKAIQEVVQARQESFVGQRNARVNQLYEQKIKVLEDKLSLKDEQIKNIEAGKTVRRIDFEARKEKRTYTKETLHIERKDLYAQLYKATSSQVSANPFVNPEAIKILGEITKNYVREGITDVAQLVDAIHQEVKDKFEGITKRDIRDAISGYGRTTERTKNELQSTVFDLKQQMQTISKIEDIESGKAPIKIQSESQSSQELQSLRDELKTKLKESGVTDQESLANSKTRIQKSLQEINDKIAKGDYSKTGRRSTPIDEEKIALQRELKDARGKYNNIQKNLGEKITDAETKQIADLSKVATDAKTKMENSPRSTGNEKPTDIEMESGYAQRYFENYVGELIHKASVKTLSEYGQWAKENPFAVPGDILKKIGNTAISLKAAWDDSWIGRQGQNLFMIGLTNPKYAETWGQTFNKSLKLIADTFGNKPTLDRIAAEIYSNADYPIIQKMKVDLGVTEEFFPTHWISKIPLGVGKTYLASENAFVGSGAFARYKLAKMFLEIERGKGTDLTDINQLESLGKVINSLTARGKWGKYSGREPGFINAILWAPKQLKGDLDVLFAHSLDVNPEFTKAARLKAANHLTRIIVGNAMVMGIANLVSPGSAEINPLSSDFGKIKVGNTRFTFNKMGALVTLAARFATGKYKSGGKIRELNSGRFGSLTKWDVGMTFLQNKTSPLARIVVDYLNGQKFDRQEPTLVNESLSLVTPFPVQNYMETVNDPKSANVILTMLADAIGITANSYSDDPNLRKVQNVLLNADKEIFSDEQTTNFYSSLDEALSSKSITLGQYLNYIKQFNELQKEAKPKEETIY